MISNAFQELGFWNHEHCTGYDDISENLVVDALEARQKISSCLLINPGPYGLQTVLMEQNNACKIECLHEWRQDYLLAQINSNGKWENNAFYWKDLLALSQKLDEYDLVVIKISKSAKWNEAILHLFSNISAKQTPILFWGMNDEGMKSLPKKANKFGFEAEILQNRKSARVIEFVKKSKMDTLSLDQANTIQYEALFSAQAWGAFSLQSILGCFGHGKLDQGTEFFMEVLDVEIPLEHRKKLNPTTKKLEVLDLGCGSGVLSHYLKNANCLVEFEFNLTSIDAHSLAIESASQNNLSSDLRWEYMADEIVDHDKDPKFDIVLTNPPFHLSKKTRTDLGNLWLNSIVKVLKPGAVVYLVANSFLKYIEMGQGYFKDIVLLRQSGGFCVYKMIL